MPEASQQPALFDDDDDAMDSREQEAADALDQGISEELALLLCPADGADTGAGDGGAGFSEAAEEAPAEDTVAGVAAGVAEAMVVAGVADADELPAAVGEDAAMAVPPPPQAEELWRQLGPTTNMGYVYDSTPRSVLRIQRGKPKNSVTVNCYLHPGCKLLLVEARCPSDEVLKQWLYEVPRAVPGSSEGRQLAATHMELGKGRWSGRKQ